MLEAAFALVLERGLENFSIADIAARSNVHETSIYRRWTTKSALVVDACLQFAEAALPTPDTGSLRSDLAAVLRGVTDLLVSSRGRTIVMVLTAAKDAASTATRHAYWIERLDLTRAIFERAVTRGEFPCHADPAVFLELLVAPLYFRLLVTEEPIEAWPGDEVLEALLRAYQIAPPNSVTP